MTIAKLHKTLSKEYITEMDEDLFIHLMNREIKIVKTHGNYFYIEEIITRKTKGILTMEEYLNAFELEIAETDILGEMIEFGNIYEKVETTHFLDIFQVYSYNPKVQPSKLYLLFGKHDYYDSDRDSISITHKDGKDIIKRTKVMKLTRVKQLLNILNNTHLSFFYEY